MTRFWTGTCQQSLKIKPVHYANLPKCIPVSVHGTVTRKIIRYEEISGKSKYMEE